MDEQYFEEEKTVIPEKKKKKSAGRWATAGIGFLVGVLLTGMIFTGGIISVKVGNKETIIRAYIKKYFIHDVEDEVLEEGKYKGMLEALEDDYSVYYTSDEMNDLSQSMGGVYRGIGVVLSQDKTTKEITVVRCYTGSPAEEAGICAGDVVQDINETAVKDMELEDVVAMIKEADEAGVWLSLSRPDESEELKIQVVPTDIEYPTVESKLLEDGIGYLAIYSFTGVTCEQFQEQMADLKEQGMTKLIVDLRGNTGGLMTAVTSMLNSILPEGVMVYTVDKDGKRTDYYSEGETPLELPMVVLVNGYTASASEIFAGAVRDYDMAVLVGTQTFGKGVVQNTVRLEDGSGIKLTTATYYTPNGVNIHGNGLEPDIEVELDTESDINGNYTDNQLEKALEVIKEM